MVFSCFPFRHVTDIYLRHLHRYYRHITATITAKKKFTPTFTPTKQYQPSALADQLPKWLLSQKYPKRDRFTPYYIKEFMGKMVGIILLNINNLSVSLCKLWRFHCASWGYFIMQDVAISLCKLRIFPLPFSKKRRVF